MITMLFLHKETINLSISHLCSGVNREGHRGEM